MSLFCVVLKYFQWIFNFSSQHIHKIWRKKCQENKDDRLPLYSNEKFSSVAVALEPIHSTTNFLYIMSPSIPVDKISEEFFYIFFLAYCFPTIFFSFIFRPFVALCHHDFFSSCTLLLAKVNWNIEKLNWISLLLATISTSS